MIGSTPAVKVTALEKAEAAWGASLPVEVRALAERCDAGTADGAAKVIGISAGAVSNVLRRKVANYDLPKIFGKIRGALMGETVECPRKGSMSRQVCLQWQRGTRRDRAGAAATQARPSSFPPTGATVISSAWSGCWIVSARAGLEGVTPHVLRHTFASVAGDLGFSELTIAGLLGHSPRGVTQGYIHLDTTLVIAAEKVALEIATILNGGIDSPRRRVQPLRLEAA